MKKLVVCMVLSVPDDCDEDRLMDRIEGLDANGNHEDNVTIQFIHTKTGYAGEFDSLGADPSSWEED